MSLIQTSNLAIGYQSNKTLQRDIEFSLKEGEIICLMGQNGVGKTTFIKTLNGLLDPLNGTVEIKGTSIQDYDRTLLAQEMGVVLTDKPAATNLTVKELIGLGRYPYSNWLGRLSSEDKAAVESAISQTKINYIEDKLLSDLSDGQFQKAMIARALAQETDILILDEPVAHLDLNNKIEILLLLREIANTGKGILISTHDIQVSLQLSDLLWLFNFDSNPIFGLPEDLILNGDLEEALYLQHHAYDLIHHRLTIPASGKVMKVIGDEKSGFWTKQALEKAGFQIGEEGKRIECEDSTWEYQGSTYHSISELLKAIRKQNN